jgi:hypothetical protein
MGMLCCVMVDEREQGVQEGGVDSGM